MANVTGYGFIKLLDLMNERVVDQSYPVLRDAIVDTLAEHTRQFDEFTGQMVQNTLEFKLRYKLPSSGSLQPLDAQGNPLPTRLAGHWELGFPIQGAGHAFGTDRVSRANMTVQELNDYTIDATTRDIDWNKRHMLAALFTNTNWIYPDEEHGDITITPLANDDTVVYLRRGGLLAADNHYLAQAAAIADGANPFPTIYTELAEHPSNTGPFFAYVASNLTASIEALTALDEARDPTIEYGANARLLRQAVDVDGTPYSGPVRHFGERLIGKANGMYIVEWASLPDNYIVAHATGVNDILYRRQYPVPALQGLIPEFHSPDGNLLVNRVIRYAGYGVANRIGAVVMRIGNASYAIPTGYEAPLPA